MPQKAQSHEILDICYFILRKLSRAIEFILQYLAIRNLRTVRRYSPELGTRYFSGIAEAPFRQSASVGPLFLPVRYNFGSPLGSGQRTSGPKWRSVHL